MRAVGWDSAANAVPLRWQITAGHSSGAGHFRKIIRGRWHVSALRKAGVWLGLVEDDDDREYDDRRYSAASTRERSSYRDSRRDSRYADARVTDDFDDEDDEDDLPVVPRSLYSDRCRSDMCRADSAGRADLCRGESVRAYQSRGE